MGGKAILVGEVTYDKTADSFVKVAEGTATYETKQSVYKAAGLGSRTGVIEDLVVLAEGMQEFTDLAEGGKNVTGGPAESALAEQKISTPHSTPEELRKDTTILQDPLRVEDLENILMYEDRDGVLSG